MLKILRRSAPSALTQAGTAVLAVLLSGCQLAALQPAMPPRVVGAQPQREVRPPSARPTATAVQSAIPELTVAARRGTLEESVVLNGSVVTGRTAQLSLEFGGTVQAVHVRPGQAVESGARLIEISLEDSTGPSVDSQAIAATSTSQAQVDEARATVARASLALREAELAREAAGRVAPSVDVASAQLMLDDANADVAQAQAATTRRAGGEPDLAGAVRAAERALAEATIHRDQVLADRSRAEAAGEIERRRARLEVEQARDDLARARQAAQQSQEEARLTPPPEAARLRAAERQTAAAAITLTAAEENERSAGNRGSPERQLAQLALDAAHDELAAARSAAQQQAAAGRPADSPGDLAVRVAERRLADAIARAEELDTRLLLGEDAKASLADMAVAQARDALAQAQAAQLDARSPRAADTASAGDGDMSLRAAERRRTEATLRLEQARAEAKREGERVGSDAARELLDLRVKAAQDALAAAEAQLRAAQSPADPAVTPQRRPSHITLLAPFAGTVKSIAAGASEFVPARATLVYLDDPASLAVDVTASEPDASRLAVGQQAEVKFSASGQGPAAGSISQFGPATMSQSGLLAIPVRVGLTEWPPLLRVGQPATVRITLRRAEDIVYVPAAAVRRTASRALVTKVGADGQVTDQPVVLGGTFGDDVEIRAGVSEGDILGVESSQYDD